MNNQDVLNGILLLVLVSWTAFGDGGLIDIVNVNSLAILLIGVFFLVDGLNDQRDTEVKSMEKRLRAMEKKSNSMVDSINTNSDELNGLHTMVDKTQNVLGYKFRMFVVICISQFENLTQEWQNHFMLSAEFSSLYEKASGNSGVLTHEEKKKYAQWMNKALESLEENWIRKFAFSEDFKIYEEIINLYKD